MAIFQLPSGVWYDDTKNTIVPGPNSASSSQQGQSSIPTPTTSTTPAAPANTAPATSTTIAPPQANLQPGMTGDAVKQLQDYLVSKGYMTEAQVATGPGIYGPQTTAAVAALQKDLGVDNSSGVGYFGPRTISALSSNSGNSTVSPTQPTTPTSTVDTTNQAGTGLVFDNKYGITPAQWNQMNDTQRAVVAAAYTAKQTAYNTDGQQLTFADALARAAEDPNIVSRFADEAKIDAQAFTQNIQELQRASSTDAEQKQMQFENDRRNLAEKYGAAGAAYSGFRGRAQEQLGKYEEGIVQSSRAQLKKNVDDATRAFEAKYGTAATTPATASFRDPFASSGISLSGQYTPTDAVDTTLTGALAGGITGTQPVAKQDAINTKAVSLYNTANATPTLS